MNETLDYLKTFAAFPFAMRRFQQKPRLTLEAAQRIVRERMQRREDNFLSLVEHNIYRHPRSPYLPLLLSAGCQLGDVQALVRQNGLEGALRSLHDAGVYVTFEEFKGRKPIIRNGQELAVRARDFDNPSARRDFMFRTGGSTGVALNVAIDLDYIASRATHYLVALDAHDLLDTPVATWQGILPDGGLRGILRGGYTGNMPRRWFSPIGWRDSKHWLKYGLATAYCLGWMRLLGMRAPLPQPVRVDQALIVAKWAVGTAQEHGRCLVRAGVSRGLRLCLAAQAAGLNLAGVTIMGGGEPATPAKVRQIQHAGARYVSYYGMVEASAIGSGCAHPVDGSDVHLFKDAFVLFAHPYRLEGFDVSVPAFNLTALLPAAPKVMLNVQMDDYGIVEERRCGCPLEAYGFTTHLREIGSYSKLTGEGVTLIGSELVRILEETLPARFGGGPLDYQLMEQEDEQALTRLYLVISPTIRIADEQAAIDTVLAGLRRSSAMGDAARTVWQNAGTIQVKRAEPVWTARGKMTPLHVQRVPAPRGSAQESNS